MRGRGRERSGARDRAGLEATLSRIDGRGYKSYRDIEGAWRFDAYDLFIDHVQSDPFASPSKMRVRMPLELAGLPAGCLENEVRRLASTAFLARRLRQEIQRVRPRRSGSGNGGLVSIDAGGPEVLARSAVVLSDDWVEARIEVGLPAAGRRTLAREAARLLCETLPPIVEGGLARNDPEASEAFVHFVDCIENQEFVRARLQALGLIAFVGDGAILPRRSGASEDPMPRERAIPFESPASLRVEIEVPHAHAGATGRLWRGMGIPKGVVLLVGGGYHGKSTLLRALEHAVVPHVPGDGRENVVADPCLVKIRAEDGRAVTGVDIEGFIDALPPLPGKGGPDGAGGRDTRSFSTEDASGSTSQAANIIEALEAGARGLLLDEDTSATNFMVRDARMQALVHPEDEPITPFVDRVRELYDAFGVSIVLVMGGSGDYFEAADVVIEMKAYAPLDATERARAIVAKSTSTRRAEARGPLRPVSQRVPDPKSFDPSRGRKQVKLSSRDTDSIDFGTTHIDLRGLDQLFDPSQTRAIAGAIHLASREWMGAGVTLAEILDRLDRLLDEEGLDPLDPFGRAGRHPGNLARPRRFEVAAAINRMRSLRLSTV